MVGVVGLEGEKDGKRVLGAEEGKCVVGEKVTNGLTEGVGEGVVGALVTGDGDVVGEGLVGL